MGEYKLNGDALACSVNTDPETNATLSIPSVNMTTSKSVMRVQYASHMPVLGGIH